MDVFGRLARLSFFSLLGFFLPNLPATAQSFTDVAVAEFWACGLTEQGEVDCITDARTERYVPPETLPLFEEITIGQQHGCVSYLRR